MGINSTIGGRLATCVRGLVRAASVKTTSALGFRSRLGFILRLLLRAVKSSRRVIDVSSLGGSSMVKVLFQDQCVEELLEQPHGYQLCRAHESSVKRVQTIYRITHDVVLRNHMTSQSKGFNCGFDRDEVVLHRDSQRSF